MRQWRTAAAALLVGCTTSSYPVTRYTWAPADEARSDPDQLRQVHQSCLQEANGTYIPNLYGAGAAIQQTLYKDCVERHGYRKTTTEDVKLPMDWDDTLKRYRPQDPHALDRVCGPDQTCLRFFR